MKKSFLLVLLLFFAVSTEAQEQRIITSDGVELYVKVKGEGTPVLYIHGGPGSGSLWFEKFFGDYMEKNFTVVYLDQRGVGRSSSPENKDYSLERMIRDFEEVREELGFDQWLTLGHSFAGILQTAYALEAPEKHKGMIMVNNTLNLRQSFCESWGPKAAEFLGKENPITCAKDTIPLMERMSVYITGLREKDLFWKMAYENKESDSIMNSTYQGIENWNYDLGNSILDYQEYWINYKPLTAQVEVPVLFFYGSRDWMIGPNHYKGIEFPEMILWKNDGGHIPFLENKNDLQEAISTYMETYNF